MKTKNFKDQKSGVAFHVKRGMHAILSDVIHEIDRAETKHPEMLPTLADACQIINEEVGEMNRAYLQYAYKGGDIKEIRKECIETVATCFRLLLNLDEYAKAPSGWAQDHEIAKLENRIKELETIAFSIDDVEMIADDYKEYCRLAGVNPLPFKEWYNRAPKYKENEQSPEIKKGISIEDAMKNAYDKIAEDSKVFDIREVIKNIHERYRDSLRRNESPYSIQAELYAALTAPPYELSEKTKGELKTLACYLIAGKEVEVKEVLVDYLAKEFYAYFRGAIHPLLQCTKLDKPGYVCVKSLG